MIASRTARVWLDWRLHLTNNKEAIKIPNCGHNELFQETETLLTINRFLTDTKKR